MVLSGRARFIIDGADHDAPAGTFVFIPDPSRAAADGDEDGTSATPSAGASGSRTRGPPWEPTTAAQRLAAAGDPP